MFTQIKIGFYMKPRITTCFYVFRSASSARAENFQTPRQTVSPSITQSPPRAKLNFREENISRAMKAYLAKRKHYERFMEDEIRQYELGKRHLANIMGEDPDSFTQRQIDEAIEYLMPSGLLDPHARPQMKDPRENIPVAKVAEFGEDGRPFHHLFYTTRPRYYGLMFQAGQYIDKLRQLEERSIKQRVPPTENDRMSTAGDWISFKAFQFIVRERITTVHYQRLQALLSRLLYHPFSNHAKDFLEQFRHVPSDSAMVIGVNPPVLDSEGRECQIAEGTRKTSTAKVFLYPNGTGKITVNAQTFGEAFPSLYDREQAIAALVFNDMEQTMDVNAVTSGGGTSGQAGALRYAIAQALCTFVDAPARERMRLAGLLTRDPRLPERKKPGKKKARKGFTWKRR